MTFKEKFILNFIKDDRWRYMWNGLGTTLKIALCAVVAGVIIGCIVAIIRSTHDSLAESKKRNIGFYILKVFNSICHIYLTVIRGTPVVVQLLIIYFVIFGNTTINKVVAAVIAFGLNSGAYVAEIVRSGIMSVDRGQFEAGRSLGFNYIQTMWFIILPQAFKNILPALGNEFIVLLKETSISGYIALEDLTKGADIIRSRTYDAFMPLVGVAIIYLIMVMILSHGVSCLERRLRSGDR